MLNFMQMGCRWECLWRIIKCRNQLFELVIAERREDIEDCKRKYEYASERYEKCDM